MKINWKKIAPELVILGIFIIASLIYYFPAVEGKVIYAGDYINGRAACQESIDFHDETGEYSFWTGSMFSGMPNYQIGANGGFTVDKILNPIRWVILSVTAYFQDRKMDKYGRILCDGNVKLFLCHCCGFA